MIFNTLDEFITSAKHGRLLGLDIGEKTIGLALSDTGRKIATPMMTIKRKKFTTDANEIFKISDEHKIAGLVIGLPINVDGTEGAKCQSVRQFARNLLKIREMDICFWDERFSTVAATETLINADVSRERRKELVDKIAASYILQGALDRL